MTTLLLLLACTSPGTEKDADRDPGADTARVDTDDQGPQGDSNPNNNVGDQPNPGGGSGKEPPKQRPYQWRSLQGRDSSFCGVLEDGRNLCFGVGTVGELEMPQVPFAEYSMGWFHGCGLLDDGSALCWGAEANSGFPGADAGQADPPAGTFHGIAAGTWQTCALDDANHIVCWGYMPPAWVPPADVEALQLSLGWDLLCALLTDHTITCWGAPDYQSWPVGDDFVDISTGSSHVCGRHADGRISCAGRDGGPGIINMDQPYPFYLSGNGVACALDEEGRVECWVGPEARGTTTSWLRGRTPASSGWCSLVLGTACWMLLGEDGIAVPWLEEKDTECDIPTETISDSGG